MSGARRADLEALERGLGWLAENQNVETGTFPQGDRYVPVATTALGALAFMAHGSLPGDGPFGDEVERAIRYLVRQTDLSGGSPTEGYVSNQGSDWGRAHAHGFATLALAQAYASSPRNVRAAEVGVALEKAVGLIERVQSLEGGWYYKPVRTLEHENSVTIGYVQALRAARNAGIEVDRNVVAKALDYIKRCQNEDGSFRYGLALGHKHTVGLTAASMVTLNAIGEYSGPEIERGQAYLYRQLWAEPDGIGRRGQVQWPYYERLYVAQALWQSGDERLFERWWADVREGVLANQFEDGGWRDSTYGDTYATTMNCLVLAMPLGFLPIFQR